MQETQQSPASINQTNRQISYQNSYEKQGCPFFKTNPPFHAMPNRTIYSNIPDQQVCNNSIKTSKYTIANFIPKNLIIQFSKVANIYFLIIGIMQMIPSISVSGGFPVIFMPLSIVVGTSAIKDFYEDLKRKKSDQQINSKSALIVNERNLTQAKKWEDIRIGNIVKIEKNQQFPADVILLASSQPNQDCFIQTKNLDGETNLKFRKVRPEVSSIFLPAFRDHKVKQNIIRQFHYEHPNPYIYTFSGSFSGSIPLNNNNVGLRGCSLKMTEWVYGLVIYTGVDTKIMLNSNKSRQKKSRLQFRMGIIVAIIFILQMILTFSWAFFGVVANIYEMGESKWISKQQEMGEEFDQQLQYIEEQGNHLFVNWGSWILLFTNFVPISLIVSLEMVKYIQGIRITRKDSQSQITVQTSTLNQQLGQIQHLFSDKTGTLTKNYMSFRYMIAGMKVYGYGDHTQIPADITNVQFQDQQLMNFMEKQKLSLSHCSSLFNMFLCFSICHNVILERQQGSKENGPPKYNASSPDQLAFINMARFAGWEYLGIDADNYLKIKYKDQILKYKLLHTIQFNSDRKRMSVIVQQPPTPNNIEPRVFVFTKGADNVMFDRIKTGSNEQIQKLQQELKQWSMQGLRTLVFTKRQIKKEYYDKWAAMYAFSLSNLQAKSIKQKSVIREMADNVNEKPKESPQFKLSLNLISKFIIDEYPKEQERKKESPFTLINKLLSENSLTESQKKFLDAHLQEIQSNRDVEGMPQTQELEAVIQKQLELIGATAIQDKLQDNVKEVIYKIRGAGVKVWMLTGDKKQTAVNIGVSCGIVSEDMAILHWNQSPQKTIKERKCIKSRQCCLVVSGEQLLSVEENGNDLLQLITACEAIVCCRVTPKQKQDMVWLMRKNRFTTLAIGDGANDVNMINTAHVGIGIKGVQGAQAALCSDYAISEFQLLGQLMLYHGRECYRKNSQLILFNFYKNLILVLPQLWYAFTNGFSPCYIYDPWVYQLYNVMFTSLPIVVYAVLDIKYGLVMSMDNPHLYSQGVTNKLFNVSKVLSQLFMPVMFSFVITATTFSIMEHTGHNGAGVTWDLLSEGMTIFVSCVIICNLRVIIISSKQSNILILTVVISVLLYFIILYFASKVFWMSEIANSMYVYFLSLDYYLIVLMNVGIVGMVEYTLEIWAKIGISETIGPSPKPDQTQIQMKMLSSHEREY